MLQIAASLAQVNDALTQTPKALGRLKAAISRDRIRTSQGRGARGRPYDPATRAG
ncbi:MAG: hypothetical protein JOZ93_12480 [Sinobacteraceae bacterium]|nr:hypothetical protein [Nevskiaceae bacterium]